MKKFYYITIIIGIILIIYWAAIALPSLFEKVSVIANDSLRDSSFSYTGSATFKATPERKDLLIPMLALNSKFREEPPNSFTEGIDDIKGFYKLEKFFSDFRCYYTLKLKIQETVNKEILPLCDATFSLNDDELVTYFNSNSDNIKNIWGLDNIDDFKLFASTIKQLHGNKISACRITETFFFIRDSGLLNFRLVIEDHLGQLIYLPVIADISDYTDYQVAPPIKFFGLTLGGIS